MANEIYHRSNWGNAVNNNAWGDVYQKFDATNEMFLRSDYYENSNETDKLMAAIKPKPSILLTPTAYNNPPPDNFIQGLNTVKPVLTKSDNLIINGNFSTDSDWTKGEGWSISGGVASCDGSQSGFSLLSQSGTFNQDKDYEVTFTITSYTSGTICSVGFTGGGSDSFTLNPSPIGVGTYSRVIRANGNTAVSVRVNPGGRDPAFIGSIDNIIVKEVTDADFDFQRLTTATRINSSGNVESVAANLPRIDYTGGVGHILFEPQSTNLVTDSAGGNYGNNPGSEILTTAPDGTNTAVRPVPDSTSDRYQYTISGGSYATDSKLTYTWYRKRITTPIDTSHTGDLKIQILVNCTQVGSTTQIETDVNGFDRFQAVFNITDGSDATLIRGYFGQSIGVGNSSIAYWGHQVEALDFATSLIPTSGSTVTRNADAANNSGSSDLINSTEGVLYAELLKKQDDNDNFILISLNNDASNSFANSVTVGFDDSDDFFVRLRANNSDSLKSDGLTATANNFHKIAIRYKSGDSAIYINGSEAPYSVGDGTGTFTFGVTLDNLSLDNNGNGSLPFFGNVKCLAVFKEALTDAQLTALTT
tara:strand:+ start:584 stop:2350 length:1767 start_codon:yes stop_codon:yes gene_type:complete